MQRSHRLKALVSASLAFCTLTGATPSALPPPAPAAASAVPASQTIEALAGKLSVGDLVFIRIGGPGPFREVAEATDSWTNHVGIVVDVSGREPLVAESAVPLSRLTPLSRFTARSEGGRLAVRRLSGALSEAQQAAVGSAARSRLGILYDTGFDLHSKRREFCTRYVREVLLEATGRSVGEVETFAALLARKPGAGLGFWKVWYFGRIPWQRETVTPASVLASAELHTVFDGVASATPARAESTRLEPR